MSAWEQADGGICEWSWCWSLRGQRGRETNPDSPQMEELNLFFQSIATYHDVKQDLIPWRGKGFCSWESQSLRPNHLPG